MRLSAAAGLSFFAIVAMPGSVAWAQEHYPDRDIRIIVGYSPGSGPDVTARRTADAIRKASGQTVIVENKPGALTNIAAQSVARAKPDGYTIFVTAGNSTMAANPWLFKSLPYDPIKDFTPVTTLLKTPTASHSRQQNSTNTRRVLRRPGWHTSQSSTVTRRWQPGRLISSSLT
jgi:tripartite-type tricarboxylate transporter receptor subunit TctC